MDAGGAGRGGRLCVAGVRPDDAVAPLVWSLPLTQAANRRTTVGGSAVAWGKVQLFKTDSP